MMRDGVINAGQVQMAQAMPITVATFESSGNDLAPYYVDSVNRALESSTASVDGDTDRAQRVQTTIDPDLQTAAEQALVHQLDALSKRLHASSRPQGALVALDPHTGHVLAMVGGRDYAESQLNRATDARRQPGSVFKPFVYAAALEAGISPLSTYSDAPQTFQYGNATYSPANYGNSYSMHDVLMRDGLVRSLNVVTVQLAMQVGLATVSDMAGRFGLPRPAPYPALALGTTEVTPLQVAAAYAAFVNEGKMVQPTVIAGVMGSDARAEDDIPSRSTQVIRPATAYMITDMLSDVTTRGTAARAKASFSKVAIAGKTGTSRDGWFVGYTPNLVCAVWIGYDDNTQLGLTGAEAALPAWIDFMKEAIAVRPSLGGAAFVKPPGITTVKVDPETGFLAGPNCPTSEVVSVASRFAPSVDCYKHRPDFPETLMAEDTGSELLAGEAEADAAERATNINPKTELDPASYDTGYPAVLSDAPPAPAVNMPTRKELNKQNRPVLVNDLAVPSKDLVKPGARQR
jgi:penicillin-binding protein 1B